MPEPSGATQGGEGPPAEVPAPHRPEELPRSAVQAAERASEQDRAYHAYVEDRRRRRHRAAGLLAGLVAVAWAVWLPNGVLRGETVARAWAGMSPEQWLAVEAAVVLAGFLASWASARGRALGLVVAWSLGAGAVVAGLLEADDFLGLSAASQALVAVMGFIGLLALLAAHLALSSWFGARRQERFLGARPYSSGGQAH